MHYALSLLVLALMAPVMLAAPTQTKTLTKRSFKVPVKGHKKDAPRDAMAQAYRKYGWDINLFDPAECLDGFLPSPTDGNSAEASEAVWIIPVYSSVPWWVWQPSSSAAALPSGSALPGSASAAPSSAVWITSVVPSQPAASSAVPSSAPVPSVPAQASSSAPAPPAASSSSPAASAPPSSPSSPSGGGSDTGEVSADPEENDSSYTSPVTIGGQKLNLDFDTGSSDLWVFNSGMPSSETSGHSVFNPSKSSTFTKYNGGSWEIQYGDGSTAKGDVGFDVVNIGGVVAEKQCVELAESVTGSFLQDFGSDGLLGLAFSSINTVEPQKQKTFFENVMDQLEKPLFTADLEEDKSGTYEFGTIDSSKYTGTINYAPIDNSNGFWQFESTTYTIDGQQHTCQTCSPTIADTGTSLILMDNDVVTAYYKQVKGAQYDSQNAGYLYPCNAQLPDFGIAVGSNTATLKGSDITYADAGNGYCFGGVQPNGGSGVQIIGDVFLKQFFAVFDGGNMQFGYAAKA